MSEMSPVLQALCDHTFTVQAMRRRIGLLHECVELVLFNNEVADKAAAIKSAIEQRAEDSDVSALMSLGDGVFSNLTTTTFQKEISALHATVDTLPVMVLYVAVVLPEVELADMAHWCRRECAPALLFDIQIDPQVVGGCAFVWNDTYHDFSFRSQNLKHPGLITKRLNTYV